MENFVKTANTPALNVYLKLNALPAGIKNFKSKIKIANVYQDISVILNRVKNA